MNVGTTVKFLFLFQVYFMPSALKRKPCCSDYISVLLYFLKRILCFVFTLYRLGSRQIWSGRLRRCAESFVVCSELGYYRTHHRSRHHRRLHLPSLCEPVPSHESTSIQRCMSRGCVRQWKRLKRGSSKLFYHIRRRWILTICDSIFWCSLQAWSYEGEKTMNNNVNSYVLFTQDSFMSVNTTIPGP